MSGWNSHRFTEIPKRRCGSLCTVLHDLVERLFGKQDTHAIKFWCVTGRIQEKSHTSVIGRAVDGNSLGRMSSPDITESTLVSVYDVFALNVENLGAVSSQSFERLRQLLESIS